MSKPIEAAPELAAIVWANDVPHALSASEAAPSYVSFRGVRVGDCVGSFNASRYNAKRLFVHVEHDSVVVFGRSTPSGTE